MDWREIPSLPALRAFEAAARHKSYSSAAAELNVTQPAIAQHVRALEAEFSQALMLREGRGMVPTGAGAALAAELSIAFGQIGRAVRDIRETTAERPLSITTTFTLAETFLMPRLPRFWAQYPEIALSVSPSVEIVDFARDGFDIGLRFGQGEWPGLDAKLLFEGEIVVVTTPELGRRRQTSDIQDLTDMTWLFDASYREADDWIASMGIDRKDIVSRDLPTITFLLSALRAGGGVTPIEKAIVLDDLREGRLVTIFDGGKDSRGYWLVSPKGRKHRDHATFQKWLLAEAAQSRG